MQCGQTMSPPRWGPVPRERSEDAGGNPGRKGTGAGESPEKKKKVTGGTCARSASLSPNGLFTTGRLAGGAGTVRFFPAATAAALGAGTFGTGLGSSTGLSRGVELFAKMGVFIAVAVNTTSAANAGVAAATIRQKTAARSSERRAPGRAILKNWGGGTSPNEDVIELFFFCRLCFLLGGPLSRHFPLNGPTGPFPEIADQSVRGRGRPAGWGHYPTPLAASPLLIFHLGRRPGSPRVDVAIDGA